MVETSRITFTLPMDDKKSILNVNFFHIAIAHPLRSERVAKSG